MARIGVRMALGDDGGAAAKRMAMMRTMQGPDLSAMWLAIRGGRAEAFFTLQKLHPEVIRARDESGSTALHWFALRGEPENIKAAIAVGAEVDARAANLQTPLMWAIVGGHAKAADALLEGGADPNTRDTLGATPLIIALQYSHTLLFLHLLDCGADPHAADARGCTVAHWAAYKGQPGILRCMRSLLGWEAMTGEDGEGYGPIHRAARGGSLDCCRFLIDECGVDPRTPAGAASREGRLVKHAGNTLGLGIGWCHPTTAFASRHLKKTDGDAEEDEAAEGSAESGAVLPAAGAAATGAVGAATSASAGGAAGKDVETGATGFARRAAAAQRGVAPVGASAFVPVGAGRVRPVAVAAATPASPGAALGGSSALEMAEDALKLMIHSAEGKGEYGDKKDLIAAQRALVAYLRRVVELYDARDRSVLGKLQYLVRRVLYLPRVTARLVVPSLFAGCLSFVCLFWARHMLAASGPGFTFALCILLLALGATYARLYFGDAGALDPYGVLGADRWSATMPWSVVRHPFADPSCYGDRFQPRARPAAPPRPVLALPPAPAAPQPSLPPQPAYSIDNPPRKPNGDIDYDALVEIELGNVPEAVVAASVAGPTHAPADAASAASPASSLPTSGAAALPAPPAPLTVDTVAGARHVRLNSDGSVDSSGSAVGSPRETAISRLFADIAQTSDAVRRAWGELGAIQPPAQHASANGHGEALSRAADVTEAVRARVCVSCGILRPLRAKHDAVTDRCYDRYDHFCYWVGSPIASGNYSAFMLFAALAWLTSGALLLAGWWYARALSAEVDLGSALNASEVTLGRNFQFLLYSWPMALYTLACGFGFAFTSWLLNRQIGLAMRNLTVNEAANAMAYPHFQTVQLGQVGGIIPALRNPFDLGTSLANVRDMFNPASVGRVTMASVAARDAANAQACAIEMQGVMTRELARARQAIEEEQRRQEAGLPSLAEEDDGAAAGGECNGHHDGAGGHGHSHGGERPSAGDKPGAAAASGGDKDSVAVSVGTGKDGPEPAASSRNTAGGAGTGLLGPGADGRSMPLTQTQTFLQQQLQRFPALMGLAMSGAINPQTRDLSEVLAQLPTELATATVQHRVMMLRANMIAGKAWEALASQQKGGGAHHGHSHGGGGGHGHSHGGGGGGGGHGHSHGGGGGGGHGHSHGGGGGGGGAHGHRH